MNINETSRKKNGGTIVPTISDGFLQNIPGRQFAKAKDDSKSANGQGGEPKSEPQLDQFTAEESAKLLRILMKTLRIKRHYELFRLMQDEVQDFIPHQILISAWGDFRKGDLTFDLISAIPGVRTGRLNRCSAGNHCSIDDHCSINGLVKNMHARWSVGGRQPLLVIDEPEQYVRCPISNCAPQGALQRMGSILVHGIHDHRDGIDSLYLALNPRSNVNGYGRERFCFMVDALISMVDDAYRRVAGLKFARSAADNNSPRDFGGLTPREVEIMEFVSQGKTNLEIADFLCISAFTVKNHLQRILRKLGAINRTEAVALQNQSIQMARRTNDSAVNVSDSNRSDSMREDSQPL